MRNKLFFIFTCLLLFKSNNSAAQSDQEMLVSDMLLIAQRFVTPGTEGAALQSSAGWFSSARDLDKWQFEFSLHGNALFIPKRRRNVRVQNSDFQILNIKDSQIAFIPTVYGEGSDVEFEGEIAAFGQNFDIEFDAIDGVNKEVLMHPFLQVKVGLPYGTDLAVRYLPKLTIEDVGFSTYGLGLKHNFNQYIKYSRPDDFQIAAVVSYSNFKLDYAFAPINIEIAELDRIDVDANFWLLQALGSKLYENFEVFGALGLTNSTFDYTMGGTGIGMGLINSELDGLSGNEAKVKGDLGFNYYFGDFKISSMFTASSFFNVNLGIHFRK